MKSFLVLFFIAFIVTICFVGAGAFFAIAKGYGTSIEINLDDFKLKFTESGDNDECSSK